MKIIDGQHIASQIRLELKSSITALEGKRPCIAVILVGENPASEIYISHKTKACNEIGIVSLFHKFPMTMPETELLRHIHQLNSDPDVDGILVQLPLPTHINPESIIQAINPDKDVDGFHPVNIGKLLIGASDGFKPCTPLGISTLLEKSGIDISGKHAVIFGRSNIVGKPMAAMLMQNKQGGNATVTIVHSKTRNPTEIARQGDILIAAVGQPHFLTVDMVKEGAVVIDVGMNKLVDASRPSGYRLVGDVDFDNVKNKCSYISPVPGGVGPMTIAMLLQNTFHSFLRKIK